VLELETGVTPRPTAFSFDRLMAGPGPLRTAFLSLPYDDGSAFFRDDEYFRNVSQFAATFDAVVSRLPLPEGSLVLDVGADLTWSTARLTERGWRAVAIDINHHLTAGRVFLEAGLDFAAVNVDMHAPVFASEVFDGVTAFNALHHTHRLDALVENLARTLKPGGYLAFIEPYWVHEQNRATFGTSQIEAGINENVYRLEEWHQTFVGHGLEPVFFVVGASFHGLYRKTSGRTRRALSLDDARADLFGRVYQAQLSVGVSQIDAAATDVIAIPVLLRNLSQAGWSSHSQLPVFASYHLRRAAGRAIGVTEWEMVSFDNHRTPLPDTVFPGDDIVVPVQVAVPSESGTYAIDIDLVHEGVSWFADRGVTPVTVTLHVGRTAG
jgi:SAM-dependent methyltransferase